METTIILRWGRICAPKLKVTGKTNGFTHLQYTESTSLTLKSIIQLVNYYGI